MNRVQKFANRLPNKAILDQQQTAEVKGGLRFFVEKNHPFIEFVVAVYRQLGADVHERMTDWCIDW